METNKLAEVFNNLQKDGINARIENRGETLLIWAVSEGYSEIALALIARGADLNAKRPDGNTALLRAACENRIDLVRTLIKSGANPDIQNNDGYTALILAKRRGNMEIYNLLIEGQASETLETNQGVTVATTSLGERSKKSLIAPRDKNLELKIIQKIRVS